MSRSDTVRADKGIIGCGCVRCVQERALLEAGTLYAVRSDYRIYGLLLRGGLRPIINDHGYHSWVIFPAWLQLILEIDGLGPGEDFLVRAVRLMVDNEAFRDMANATHRIAGPLAVLELLEEEL